MRPSLSGRDKFALLKGELTAYRSFFQRKNRKAREVVFYAAQAQYIAFYQGLLRELADRGVDLTYITSDFDDPLLSNHADNISPIYFKTLFPFVLPFLDARVVVMTMPDLQLFHIRRSIYETNHIYMFHSLMSTHMGFRPGALDHFDTIFCAGPHQLEEIRQTEKLNNLKPKTLVGTGYYRLEKIYADHQIYLSGQAPPQPEQPPCILIAPSGHETNIMAMCADVLVLHLLNAGFRVVLRPHPMTIYTRPEQVQEIVRKFSAHENFQLDLGTASEDSLHEADVLISDWSGVALEYAFGTERPVIFIDLPRRQQNPAFEKLGIPPIEIFVRDKIGKAIQVAEIPEIGKVIQELLQQREAYRAEIVSLRARFVFNFGNSSQVEADSLLEIYHRPLGPGSPHQIPETS